MGLTYAKAGVDIEKKALAAKGLISNIRYSRKGLGARLDIEGHFTGLIDFGDSALTLCTDGVGTKILIAEALDKWDTIGIDCVAMNANDTICVGAEPISFVDYLAMERADARIAAELGKGLSEGARQAGVSIVGGETAILPSLVHGLDLSGTCLGYVKKSELITGSGISVGDALVGIGSTGVHSNGLTLARKILDEANIGYNDKFPSSGRTAGEVLIEPTKIYVREILKMIKRFRENLTGLANITGGGVRNIPRLKKGVKFVIDDPIKPQKEFAILQHLGRVSDEEMYQTFNMGMGFCIVCKTGSAESLVRALKEYYNREGRKFGKKVAVKVVGRVENGEGVALPGMGISYKKAKC